MLVLLANACILFVFLRRYSSIEPSFRSNTPEARTSPAISGQDFRVAVLIPWYGSQLPFYYPLFATSIPPPTSRIDFIIVHEPSVKIESRRSNLRYVSMTIEEMCDRYAAVVAPTKEKRHAVSSALRRLAQTRPYYFVELKPLIGAAFSDLLDGYSHWVIADMDVIYGDLTRWIDSTDANRYDVVSFSMGDMNRAYLRGQWTMIRNVPAANDLWRRCTYFRELDKRFGRRRLDRFHSSEGCHSWALAQASNIRAKITTAFFFNGPFKRFFFVGGKIFSDDGGRHSTRSDRFIIREMLSVPGDPSFTCYTARQIDTSRQDEVVSIVPQTENCTMRWVRAAKYRTCLEENAHSTMHSFDLVRDLGAHANEWTRKPITKPEHCARLRQVQEGAFVHVQNWKKMWHSWSIVLPLRHSNSYAYSVSSLGVIAIRDSRRTLATWFDDEITDPYVNLDPATRLWCTVTKPANKADSKCTRWSSINDLHFITKSLVAGVDRSNAVTLAIASRGRSSTSLRVAVDNAIRWEGPVVLLLSCTRSDLIRFRRDKAFHRVVLRSSATVAILVVDDDDAERENLSEKALLDLAIDMTSTRFVLPISSHHLMTIPTGASRLILDAFRRVEVRSFGSALIVPVFEPTRCLDISSLRSAALSGSVSSVLDLHERGAIHAYRHGRRRVVSCANERGNDEMKRELLPSLALSWRSHERDVVIVEDEWIRTSHRSPDTSLVPLTLNEDVTKHSFSRMVAPLLAIDLYSPVRDRALVRHVHEHNVPECFDAAYVWALLEIGYHIYVAPNVFGVVIGKEIGDNVYAFDAMAREDVTNQEEDTCRPSDKTIWDRYRKYMKETGKLYEESGMYN